MSWPVSSLESIAEKIDYGLTASAVQTDGPRFLRITDLQHDTVNWESVPSCVCNSQEINQYRLRDGDIVFARTGATTGKSYRLDKTPQNAVFASYLIRVRPKAEMSSSYLGHFFKSPLYWHQITKMANGAAQPGVNSSKLKELEVPVPPLQEQKRIAAILDKADAIRRKRQQATLFADEFLHSVFLDMFGDPVTNPKGWEIRTLKDISSRIHSGSTPQGGSKVYVDKGILFLRSQNVWRNNLVLDDVAYIDEATHKKMSKSSLKNKDILITKTGRFNTEKSSLGRAAMYLGKDDSANVNGHVYLVRLHKDVVNEFVLHILTTNEYREYIRRVCVGGIDKRQINKEHLEEFPIIYPSLEKQEQFARLILYLTENKTRSEKSLISAEMLFNALSQQAFRGDL